MLRSSINYLIRRCSIDSRSHVANASKGSLAWESLKHLSPMSSQTLAHEMLSVALSDKSVEICYLQIRDAASDAIEDLKRQCQLDPSIKVDNLQNFMVHIHLRNMYDCTDVDRLAMMHAFGYITLSQIDNDFNRAESTLQFSNWASAMHRSISFRSQRLAEAA